MRLVSKYKHYTYVIEFLICSKTKTVKLKPVIIIEFLQQQYFKVTMNKCSFKAFPSSAEVLCIQLLSIQNNIKARISFLKNDF